MLPSVVVADVHCLVGRRALFWRGPGLQSFPGRLELRFGLLRSLDEPIGSLARQVESRSRQPASTAWGHRIRG